MKNFVYDIPTIVYFGDGQLSRIGELAASLGKKALILYGGGSVKENGLFGRAVYFLEQAGVTWEEMGGVEPNPRIESVRRGVEICRDKSVDMVIPIGGGSVIDCAKAIAVAVDYEGDPWDLVVDPGKITKALPIITVLTIAATGTEMDFYSVISNMETNDKISFDHRLMFPTYSIMDPGFTETVSPYQTASGAADILSHIFEVYFQDLGDTFMQDRIMEGLMQTVVTYGPAAYQHPTDYDARANLMWASSWAINGMIACGKSGAWVCHPMEHQLSAFYDVTHGMGLAVLIPHWMEKILDDSIVGQFVSYGVHVWGISPELPEYEIARKAIEKTRQWYRSMNIPTTLRELGIRDKKNFEIMAQKAAKSTIHAYCPLDEQDVLDIYNAAF